MINGEFTDKIQIFVYCCLRGINKNLSFYFCNELLNVFKLYTFSINNSFMITGRVRKMGEPGLRGGNERWRGRGYNNSNRSPSSDCLSLRAAFRYVTESLEQFLTNLNPTP